MYTKSQKIKSREKHSLSILHSNNFFGKLDSLKEYLKYFDTNDCSENTIGFIEKLIIKLEEATLISEQIEKIQ